MRKVARILVATPSSPAYITCMSITTSPTSQAEPRVADQQLAILTEIGQILSSTLELRDAFGKVMQIISDQMNMHRGTLVLLDESSGRLRTEAARSEERRVGKECRSR